jgi:hypothetical protein
MVRVFECNSHSLKDSRSKAASSLVLHFNLCSFACFCICSMSLLFGRAFTLKQVRFVHEPVVRVGFHSGTM